MQANSAKMLRERRAKLIYLEVDNMSIPIKQNELIYPIKFDLTKDALESFCNESYSLAEVIKKSGRNCTGGNYQLVKAKIAEYGIDISHFTGQSWNKGKTHQDDPRILQSSKYTSDNEILGYHPEIDRKVVKRYVLRHNIIPYKCAMCGNTGLWMGEKMTLELDHKNGDPYDHSPENLRFLCPNCHAITPTYVNKSRSNKL